MKIFNANQVIRQQHPGRFRRPEDGKKPFTYVKDQKLANPNDVKKTSIYITDVNVVTLEKGLKADFPKLFDFDSGVKYNARQIRDVKKTEDQHQSYNQTGKTKFWQKETTCLISGPDGWRDRIQNEHLVS